MENIGNELMVATYFFIFSSFLLSGMNCQTCKNIEMVINGNFSLPVISSTTATTNSLPGGSLGTWKTDSQNDEFKLWQQGQPNSPVEDAFGFPTGQHLEIFHNISSDSQVSTETKSSDDVLDLVFNFGFSKLPQISYEFDVPCLLGSALANFPFQWWADTNYGAQSFKFQAEQKRNKNLQETVKFSTRLDDRWTSVIRSFEVQACAPLKLIFEGDSNGGLHIDDVSLQLQVCEEVETIVNGGFEEPKIVNPFLSMNLVTIPDKWSTPPRFGLVLWQQGVLGVPTTSPTGRPTGQHLEINGYYKQGVVRYESFIPVVSGVAEGIIKFDYWLKPTQIINYFNVTLLQNNTSLLQQQLHNGLEFGVWQRANFVVYNLTSNKPALLIFSCESENVGGVRIDNVSMKIVDWKQNLLFTN